MAIPFSLPSDDSTLEQYRSIHQLLLDLMALLRTLLASNTEVVQQNVVPNVANPSSPPLPAFNPANQQYGISLLPTPPPSPFETGTASTSAFVLPDVVTSAMNNPNNDFANSPYYLTPSSPPPNQDDDTYVESNHISRRRLSAELMTRRSCSIGSNQNKLRKRKHAKLSKKKKKFIESVESLAQMAHLNNCAWSTCDFHKIPKITGCSCFYDEDDDDVFNEAGCVQKSRRTDVPNRVFHSDKCCAGVHQCGTSSNDFKIPVSVYIGEEMRKIVEYFRHSPKKNGANIASEDIVSVKGTSLISHFGRTMFTAVLLVIGWKLLKQN